MKKEKKIIKFIGKKKEIYKELLNSKIPKIIINKNSIEILFPFIITAASRPQFTKYGVTLKEPYKSFKQFLNNYMEYYFSFLTEEYLKEEYLGIELLLFYKLDKKSNSKKHSITNNNTYRNKMPDLDNVEKSLLDSLNCVLVSDDSKIVYSKKLKISISEENCTYIKIRKLNKKVFNKYNYENITNKF